MVAVVTAIFSPVTAVAAATVAAVAVAAHEMGHVMQKKDGYALYKLRTALVPAVNIGSWLAMPLVLIGILLDFFVLASGETLGFYIAMIGVALYGGSFLFALVTLPVELDASRRAQKMLIEEGILTQEKLLKSVLKTMTYALSHLGSDDPVFKSATYSTGDTMRGQVSTNIAYSGGYLADKEAFMYNTTMSAVDNIVYNTVGTALGIPGFVGIANTLSSFDNTYNEALSRGIDPDNAFLYSTAMSALEGATEQIKELIQKYQREGEEIKKQREGSAE